eukprot:TRINITY_DN7376_c0_g1_i2.p2 TRINITY_DN7376_c0_g1~~TRINITY_DN7376_c0_g1_i2.p2  ORF type:complete len:287 (+),score=120.74 TRINITY_DN7376_c0_g1_i2:101-862(+)
MTRARTAILAELERKEREVLLEFRRCCASASAMHDAIVRGDLALSFLSNQRRSLAMVICGFPASDASSSSSSSSPSSSSDAHPSNDAVPAGGSADAASRFALAPEVARAVLDTFLKHDRRQNYAAVRQRDAFGNNVLHYCAASDQHLCIPLVLDTGYVNINAKNMDWIGDQPHLLERRKSAMEERRQRRSVAKKARDRKRIDKEEVELQRTALNIAIELRHERSVAALAWWEPFQEFWKTIPTRPSTHMRWTR